MHGGGDSTWTLLFSPLLAHSKEVSTSGLGIIFHTSWHAACICQDA
jgi:hypothetical protein